ncbi:hypothetical protein [Rhizobium leguminosarum]|uniref:hypothetical protein n=1 Tax=Rhizobium leguminosarum TaxID=384 RepID=UPI003F9E97A3
MRNRAASLPGGNVSKAAYPSLETIRDTDFEQLLNKAPAAGNEPGFPNLQLTRSAEAWARTKRAFQRVISPRLKQTAPFDDDCSAARNHTHNPENRI